jgi:hypothetical protein
MPGYSGNISKTVTVASVLAVVSPAGNHVLAAVDPRAARSIRQSASPQERSALRVTLVSTVVVVPARLSLCQIRNDETHSTRVFRVGDELQGWRINQIAKDQVWLGSGTKLEYLERSRSGDSPAAPVGVNPHEGQYVHGQ